MIITIPMAGEGSRFPKDIFPLQKPLIECNGTTLLEYSLRSLPIPNASKVIFVMLKSQLDSKLTELISRLCKDVRHEIIYLEKRTRGQAETIFQAIQDYSVYEELLVHNCDTALNSDWVFDSEARGLLFTFESQSNSYSYAKVNSRGLVTQVAEKEVISRNASSGTYWFKSVEMFFRSYTLHSAIQQQGELFVAPLYQELIDAGEPIKIKECLDVFPLGTPSDLQASSIRIQNWKPFW